MKKYISIFSGLILVLSLGIASAQNVSVGVNQICLERNSAGVCTRSASVNVGSTQTGGQVVTGGTAAGGVQTGGVMTNGQPVAGSPAYQQGVNTARQTNTADLSFIGNLLAQLGGIIKMLPPILMGAAVVVFFWYLIKYFITEAPDEKNSAVKRMGYSLIAIFIMVALWGIIAFFGNAIGINPNVQVNAPKLPQ